MDATASVDVYVLCRFVCIADQRNRVAQQSANNAKNILAEKYKMMGMSATQATATASSSSSSTGSGIDGLTLAESGSSGEGSEGSRGAGKRKWAKSATLNKQNKVRSTTFWEDIGVCAAHIRYIHTYMHTIDQMSTIGPTYAPQQVALASEAERRLKSFEEEEKAKNDEKEKRAKERAESAKSALQKAYRYVKAYFNSRGCWKYRRGHARVNNVECVDISCPLHRPKAGSANSLKKRDWKKQAMQMRMTEEVGKQPSFYPHTQHTSHLVLEPRCYAHSFFFRNMRRGWRKKKKRSCNLRKKKTRSRKNE